LILAGLQLAYSVEREDELHGFELVLCPVYSMAILFDRQASGLNIPVQILLYFVSVNIGFFLINIYCTLFVGYEIELEHCCHCKNVLNKVDKW
jgi:hypothetical protein